MESALRAEICLIAAAVTGLLLFWTARRETKSSPDVWLIRALTAFLVQSASLCLFSLCGMAGDLPPVLLAVSRGSATVSFLTLPLGVLAWCGYAVTEMKSPLFRGKKARITAEVLTAVPMAAAVLNPFTGWLFTVGGSGACRFGFLFHGEMVWLAAGASLVSAGLLRHAGRESDPVRKSHQLLTASFPLCLLAAWILSFAGCGTEALPVFVMLDLLCIYVGSTNRQISTDSLTQVNNRQNLIRFMEYRLKNNDGSLFFLMIDVDDFKSINDTYGHLAGDEALVRTASALKQSCAFLRKRPYIARYGGDEFIVVMEGEEGDVDALVRRVGEMIARGGEEERIPFPLSLSFGVARYRPGMTRREFIAEADRALYRIKEERRAGRRN